MSTPQVRSREMLTEDGYLVATVEAHKRFPDKKKEKCRVCENQPMIEVKVDLWNCFDLIAEHPERKERLYVQVTGGTGGNHAARRNKILSSFEAKLVLLAGAKIRIHSWRKDDSINRWVVRDEEITLKHFLQAPHYPNTVRELREIRRKEKQPDLPPGASLPFRPIKDSELPF